MEKTCPHRPDLAASLTGDLPPAAQRALFAHLAECAACRSELASLKHSLERLRQWPDRSVSPGFSARVRAEIAALPTDRVRWPQRFRWVAAAAAVLVVSAVTVRHFQAGRETAIAAMPPQEPAPAHSPLLLVQSSRDLALNWLCRTQEADGSWDPGKWDGDIRFGVSLTALPLLALLHDGAPQTEPAREAAARAIQRLKLWQRADGVFGPGFYGQPLNQSLATLALLHAQKQGMLPVDDCFVLQKALPHVLQASQSLESAIFEHNPNLLWQHEVLDLARQTGWSPAGMAADAPPPRQASQGSLASAPPVRFPGLPQGEGIDLVQAYALAQSVSLADAAPVQASLREFILTAQIHQGAERGSWDPGIDRWGAVGGRVYATSMALLALH
ncbi:MAG: hypothetical protein KA004_13320 [Verrucomicrobiales bacterium]|nr:hypothetical protein [Verrucomicrobiales bacterium]